MENLSLQKMKRVNLEMTGKPLPKIGSHCPDIEPNITEDTVFYIAGEPVGFYIRKMTGKAENLAAVANAELISKRVKKTEMQRPKMLGIDPVTGKGIVDRSCKQYSAILGSVPAKPHMKREYNTISSLHSEKPAGTFIKAMKLLCYEAEEIMRKLMPEQFERQLGIMEAEAMPKYRFGRLFTSSISNCNISAPYHRDNANLKNTVNIIINKKRSARGGNLNIPEYDATIDGCDGSMLVYPAWMSVHGVTPIHKITEDGYRNSLVFYPLSGFRTEKGGHL